MTEETGNVAATIEQMLDAMEKWGASDLFVSAGKVPGVRLHGSVVPMEIAETTREDIESFLEEAISAERLAQFQRSGDLDAGYALPNGKRFRLNLAVQLGSPSIVARALPGGDLAFQDLGLPSAMARWAERPRGLVLVTGATGSGKSTSLAAMLNHINSSRQVHIVTVEEPIEFVHKDKLARVTQREVGTDTESFEVALRQVLRESPDVIFIGELRTQSAMRLALQAALTGHLVLATLHTVDVAQTLQRIITTFPEHEAAQVALDLSLTLVGIAAQRLLPKLDGTGRTVAVELLQLSPAAARLIREQRSHDLQDLLRSSTDEGVVTFDRALFDLYKAGTVSYEAGCAYASNEDEFALAARGITSGVASTKIKQVSGSAGLDIKALLSLVAAAGASDLHLSVGRPPILRIAGQLHTQEMQALSPGDVQTLLHSVMSVRQRSQYELDRELDFALGLEEGRRFRVNAYYERGNMAAAFRSISSEVPQAEALGLPKEVLRLGSEAHGLLLVVGPTGSGKTTTLACLLDRINRTRSCHIITIEDPIEYVHQSALATIHQREVHADTHSFASALKYILRQDPDVVLIGELRDLESISAALTAAETGHLVLATLHTNDAVQTIDRIVDVFPPHQQAQTRAQLAASLLGVVSQRLLTRADGEGRVAAIEVMVASPAIRAMIREQKMHQALGIMQASRVGGMVTLDAAIEQLAREGVVDTDEAARHMLNPASLDKDRG